jgi:hypothetical protein
MISTRLFLGLVLSAILQISTSECRADELGWKLDQTSHLTGDSITYVCTRGARTEFKKQGYTLITCAPEWKAFFFNDDSKLYYKTTLKDYVEKITHTTNVSGSNDVDTTGWVKTTPRILNGKKLEHYTYTAKNEFAEVKTAECWFSPEIPLAPPVAKLIEDINRTPPNSHMVIQIIYRFNNDHIGTTIIDTKSAERVQIPAGMFAYPKNYRPASNYMQVVMGKLGRTVMDVLGP